MTEEEIEPNQGRVKTGRDKDGTGRDGTGRDGTRRDGTGRDGVITSRSLYNTTRGKKRNPP